VPHLAVLDADPPVFSHAAAQCGRRAGAVNILIPELVCLTARRRLYRLALRRAPTPTPPTPIATAHGGSPVNSYAADTRAAARQPISSKAWSGLLQLQSSAATRSRSRSAKPQKFSGARSLRAPRRGRRPRVSALLAEPGSRSA
jgi:hypothetical protein